MMAAVRKPDNGLLTCRQVAFNYGVNIETVRRWVRKGAIDVVLVGPTKRIRITTAEAARHFQPSKK